MKKYIKIMMVAVLGAYACSAAAREDATRDSIMQLITGAEMPTYTVSITKLGAKGDGVKDCKPAFDRAMRVATRRGGAHIVVPKGTYLLQGPIHLVSNVCIDLQEGAVLRFSATPADYLPVVKTSWEGTFVYNYSPFIYGYGLHDVSIIGKGTIDGNAAETFATWRARQKEDMQLSRKMNHEGRAVEERRFGEGHYLRPQLIQLYKCKGVTVSDVMIINSPFWCVHLLQSENVVCRGIRYDAKLVNNDGIDPEMSRNVLIEDVHFNNGDDNVAIKSGRDNDGWTAGTPSENIIIRGCHFKGLHAVVIGSEMSAGVRNVWIDDCDYAGYCKRALYIKTNPDRGGYVENINMRNCTFDEVEDLCYVTSMYAGEGLKNTHFSDIRGVHIDGLRCRKVRSHAFVLQGTTAKPIRDVTIRRADIGEARHGLSFEHTEDVRLQDCHIGEPAGVPSQVSEKDKIFAFSLPLRFFFVPLQ